MAHDWWMREDSNEDWARRDEARRRRWKSKRMVVDVEDIGIGRGTT